MAFSGGAFGPFFDLDGLGALDGGGVHASNGSMGVQLFGESLQAGTETVPCANWGVFAWYRIVTSVGACSSYGYMRLVAKVEQT